MTIFTPQTEEISLAINATKLVNQELDPDGSIKEMEDSIISEAARVAEKVADVNYMGDTNKPHLNQHNAVEMSAQWKDAYDTLAQGGWVGVCGDEKYGGLGLSRTIGTAVNELLQTASISFSLCHILSQGLIEALEIAGTQQQRELFLAKLNEGTWTGTMNLTEPQAGTDLASIETSAVLQGDHYRITGRKIYITYGEHDLTENIVHLVLARIKGAPKGIKGISAFIVPKYLVGSNSEILEKNDINCVRLENKLGIKGSPTAELIYGDNNGAVGYLLGKENRGIEYMFIMMNRARFEVGLQGLGIAERAFQQAKDYANTRIQGKTLPEENQYYQSQPTVSKQAIIGHPAIKLTLIEIKSIIAAVRLMSFNLASSMEIEKQNIDQIKARVGLLIPIFKGWATEIAQEVSTRSLQVHGGSGFIEDSGVAQHFRDARILNIYEGTTTIQANDLAFRKIKLDQGKALKEFIQDIGNDSNKLKQQLNSDDCLDFIADKFEFSPQQCDQIKLDLLYLSDSLIQYSNEVNALVDKVILSGNSPRNIAAMADSLLMVMGWICGGWEMAKISRLIIDKHSELHNQNHSSKLLASHLILAGRYGCNILPRVESLIRVAKNSKSLDVVHHEFI